MYGQSGEKPNKNRPGALFPEKKAQIIFFKRKIYRTFASRLLSKCIKLLVFTVLLSSCVRRGMKVGAHLFIN
jgi:hypothetical protein